MTRARIIGFLAVVLASALHAQTRSYTSGHFSLLIDGSRSTALLKSVDGGYTESEIVEMPDVPKTAGRPISPDVTLRRVVDVDHTFVTWRKLIEDGTQPPPRKNAVLVFYDNQGNEVTRWKLQNAWPSKIAIEIDADTGDPVEVITLTVDSMSRQ